MVSSGADIGGEIRVTLQTRDGRIEAVDIASTRPTEAARVFVSKPVGEMCDLIGRVFSLCGKAQTVAALRASEAALGIPSSPAVEAARDLAVLAEMLTQTTIRLALHWPRVLGLDMRPDLVRACLAAEAAIETQALGVGWRTPGVGVSQPPETLAMALGALDSSLSATDLPGELAKALAGRKIETFGALPPGMPPEAGAFARGWDLPQVAQTRARHGAGLAARLSASRAELEDIPLRMIALLAHLSPVDQRAPSRETGHGAATVETARGPLTHRLRIEGGIVTDCATAAPTEANFTATGPVAAGLTGAALDPIAAELHVLAIDPCVGCLVEVKDA